jgi:hypothetical protein
MADKSHVWQSSPLTAVPKVANRPRRTADRRYLKDGRACLVLVATAAVATNAWALFRLPDESGPDVPRVTASPPSAADVNSARQGVAGNPLELSRANAFRLMDADLVSSEPTMDGPAAWYPSPVANVSQVSVRSKLQALLMMLSSQSGVVDPAALEAKLQALLTLPDSVLAQLMEHPDLADLNKTLDAVFLGTTDLSGVKTELDKIDVTSVPGPSEQIDVVQVNDKPAYIVHTSAVQNETEDAAGAPVSALPPPPGAPVTVTVLSLVQAPARPSASTFPVAPTSQQLAPPPPAPAALSASTFTVAPTSQQLAPPPRPTPTPTARTPTAPVEPPGIAKKSNDDLNSGTTNSGSTTNNGRSTTNGGSTPNGGSTSNKGGSTPNKGGHAGDTDDGAKKDAHKGEK